jgi:hypothetical protein
MVNDGFSLIFEIRHQRQAVNPPNQWIQLVPEITEFLTPNLGLSKLPDGLSNGGQRPAHPFLRD